MPVFRNADKATQQLQPRPFSNEKDLQTFFEENLDTLLGVRFVASEHPTGEKHGGRIDTLGLDEDGNPTIIEYKWDESASVINQGLYYLDWLVDHRGDFQVVAEKRLGSGLNISWQSPRLVIVARSYTKYDTYAINRILASTSVQLLRYERYDGGIIVLDSLTEPLAPKPLKAPKPPVRPDEVTYDLDYHLSQTTPEAKAAFEEIREQVLSWEGVEERAFQKSTITYRVTKSFAAFAFRKSGVECQFKGALELDDPDQRAKDIRSRQWGYPWACYIKSSDDVEPTVRLVRAAYELEH